MKNIIYAFICIILLASIVNAIGIVPAANEMIYESAGEKDFTVRIVNNEQKSMSLSVYVKGALADFIKLDENTLTVSPDEFERKINYKLFLPPNLKPGTITGEIFVVETPDTNNNIVSTNLGVSHKVSVKVPYPDQYLEGILYIDDAKPKQDVDFTISLINVGSKMLNNISGNIIIKDASGIAVAEISTNMIDLDAAKKSKITAKWFADVSPGTYHAEAIVRYDKKLIVIDKEFDLGEPLLDISDLQIGSFKLGAIAKFDIILENKWNQLISNAFTNTEIRDNLGSIVDQYKSSSVNVQPSAKNIITYYWDTKNTKEGEYTIGITANYLGRTNEKTYGLNVMKDKIIVTSPSFTGNIIKEEPTKPAGVWDKIVIIIIAFFITIVVLVKIFLDYKLKMNSKPKQ
jgi:hypothetical protein